MNEETAPETAPEIALKDEVLLAMLPNIVFDGWSRHSFAEAGKSLGLSVEELARVFPGGADGARHWLDDWADRQMLARLAETEAAELRLSERVARALEARLDALSPYREAVRLALAARLNPLEWGHASAAAYATVDRIWRAVGDRSVDFSWYTKRASLAGIHGASLLYWLADTSPDFAETKDFIARRIADLGRIPLLRRRAKSAARPFTAPFEFFRRGTYRY